MFPSSVYLCRSTEKNSFQKYTFYQKLFKYLFVICCCVQIYLLSRLYVRCHLLIFGDDIGLMIFSHLGSLNFLCATCQGSILVIYLFFFHYILIHLFVQLLIVIQGYDFNYCWFYPLPHLSNKCYTWNSGQKSNVVRHLMSMCQWTTCSAWSRFSFPGVWLWATTCSA